MQMKNMAYEMFSIYKDKAPAIGTVQKAAGYEACKRWIDVSVALCALFLLSPFFALIALCIKLEDPAGKVFYVHNRIGYRGKKLGLYKFRSMVYNAEDMIQSFTPEQRKEFHENFKLENDPRITRVGKFLRATSLDELPQLLNILKGELSLVGPRPVVKAELEKYGRHRDKLVSVLPGLTGYWQANGRSATTYGERMEMELYYVDNRSFALDMKILLKTAGAVLSREGAY